MTSRPQHTPRMTDSTSGPNGPHSLAFASLSVQSYHLDSPPFTGTSMGSYGPLAQEGQRLADQEKEKEAANQKQNQNQDPDQTTSSPSKPFRSNSKKASSPLSRAVRVDEMSRIVDDQEEESQDNDRVREEKDLNGTDSNLDSNGINHHQGAFNSNSDAQSSETNSGTGATSDRDVPRWELDGSTSTSSSSQSLASQSTKPQSQSPPPTTTSTSIDSGLTSIPQSNSVSRGPPPFGSSGSGESSGITTPVCQFPSSSSNSKSKSNSKSNNTSSSNSFKIAPSSIQTSYSGAAHSSMESNSHSHAGSTSPPAVNQSQSQSNHQRNRSFPRDSNFGNGNGNGNERRSREDSNSRPHYTQLASQDSSSEHEGEGDGDGEEAEGPSGISRHPVDEEVDGDDTTFVIQHGQSNGAAIGGSATLAGSSRGVPVQGSTKENYKFPRHRLPTRMRDESKTPLVIVACGSFSPPTYLHLRIFEMAKDQIIESGKYELLGGYYSPVSDYYKKEGLAPARHRVRMCELAVEKTSTWLMVDAWESLQDEYQRTAVVLDHFDHEINGPRLSKSSSRPSTAINGNGNGSNSNSSGIHSTTSNAFSSSSGSGSGSGSGNQVEGKERGGVLLSDGSRKRIKIMLLAGGDLIQSMGEPGIWASPDLHHILGRYGCLIVERTGADVWSFLLSHDLLWKYRRNLKIVKQTIYNDISSSKVRLFVRRGQSIKYLLPNSVIHYIEKHKLYRLPPAEEEDEAALDDENW